MGNLLRECMLTSSCFLLPVSDAIAFPFCPLPLLSTLKGSQWKARRVAKVMAVLYLPSASAAKRGTMLVDGARISSKTTRTRFAPC
jgi:hypothetical protein